MDSCGRWLWLQTLTFGTALNIWRLSFTAASYPYKIFRIHCKYAWIVSSSVWSSSLLCCHSDVTFCYNYNLLFWIDCASSCFSLDGATCATCNCDCRLRMARKMGSERESFSNGHSSYPRMIWWKRFSYSIP